MQRVIGRSAATLSVLAALLLQAGPAFGNAVQPSAWDEPTMTSAVTIDLSKVAATQPNDSWAISQAQDVKFVCSSNPVVMPHDLSIWGGDHVTLEGCDLQNTDGGRAVYPHNTGSELYLHDDSFQSAPGALDQTEGIDLQEPGSVTVVMRDVLIGSSAQPLQGSFGTNHADCEQAWSGPQRLLEDGVTCYSQYQGFFLLPNQHDPTTSETVWDFRHVNLHLSPGGYAFTFGTNGPQHVDLSVDHVYADGPGQPLLYQGGEGFEDALGSGLGTDYVYPTGTGASGADDLPVDPMPFPGEN